MVLSAAVIVASLALCKGCVWGDSPIHVTTLMMKTTNRRHGKSIYIYNNDIKRISRQAHGVDATSSKLKPRCFCAV